MKIEYDWVKSTDKKLINLTVVLVSNIEKLNREESESMKPNRISQVN